jgi:hypothetical protein
MLTSLLAATVLAAPLQMDMKNTSISVPKIAKSASALPAIDLDWKNMEGEHFYFCQLNWGEVNVESKYGKVCFVKVTSEEMRDSWSGAFGRMGLSTSGVRTEERQTDTGGRMLVLSNVKGIPASMPVCWVPGSLYVGTCLK